MKHRWFQSRLPAPALSSALLVMLLLPSLTVTVSVTDSQWVPSSEKTSTQFGSKSRNYWPTNGWLNSTPEEQGMDSRKLQEMMNYVTEEDLSIHSIVIIRHGYRVLEEHLTPTGSVGRTYSLTGTHYLYSATKSFTSCLMGIAVDRGYVENVGQTVVSFFPNRTIANLDERKERMTVENLLTMRSGLPWDESSAPFTSPLNDIYHLDNEPAGGVQYVLDMPMEAEPNSLWHYNTGASHLLSGIIQEVTGMTTLEFALENLFSPLGISNLYWNVDRQGVNYGGYDLQLTPEDMAKFGYLFLNNGTWDGEQIVSEEWVASSTGTFTQLNSYEGYGYQWWTLPAIGAFYAAGLYGQFIFVVPEQDLVVAFTSGFYASERPQNPEILYEYILPAVIDSDYYSSRLDIVNPFIVIVMFVPVLALGPYFVVRKNESDQHSRALSALLPRR